MSRTLPLMFCLVVGLLVVACSKTAETNHNAAATNSAAPATSPATATHTPATTAAAGDHIGVPECDAFITAYENCVNAKVPEAQRATFQTGLKTWRTEWKKLAENPQTKSTLVEVCKKQQELQRSSLNKLYGCTL